MNNSYHIMVFAYQNLKVRQRNINSKFNTSYLTTTCNFLLHWPLHWYRHTQHNGIRHSDTQHYLFNCNTQHNVSWALHFYCCAECLMLNDLCWVSFAECLMLNVLCWMSDAVCIMLNVMLSVLCCMSYPVCPMLNVVMLITIMLNVLWRMSCWVSYD